MVHILNDPMKFAGEAVHGLAAAYPTHVAAVHGGVVRSTESPSGQVSVVLGGGSGHYPAFAGWVGPGMAHGAVCGNIFASPSASQVYSVVRSADNGGGVILGFGNYAGDVLHFGQAAERLRAEGIDVRIVTVTDDIASGPADQPELRRGIAGDVVVFKIAGAAAEAGLDLDAVERVARRANERTRTLGIAFAGCTLPGADHALFTVPDGMMAMGLGIHGEPGLREVELGSARQVADELVDSLLAEEPERGTAGYEGNVAVLLNGLGATKYEELFVVYQRVAERLAAAGLTVVIPEVGEHVTSLDMAGLSLTFTFLDEELERFWRAPADTPAFRRSNPPAGRRRSIQSAAEQKTETFTSSPESHAAVATVRGMLRAMVDTAVRYEVRLGELDAVAGDGDHGQGILLGTTGAYERVKELYGLGAGVRTALIRAGTAWSDAAGGTSGALWGAALTAAGSKLSDDGAPTVDDIVAAVGTAADAVVTLGGARPGDKTLVDALVPFVDTLRSAHASGSTLREAWEQASATASRAAGETAQLTARLGRARSHGQRSVGSPDPGATSFALLMSAAGEWSDLPPQPSTF